MTGNGDGTEAGEGPQQADGDLTGDVRVHPRRRLRRRSTTATATSRRPPANTAPDRRGDGDPDDRRARHEGDARRLGQHRRRDARAA